MALVLKFVANVKIMMLNYVNTVIISEALVQTYQHMVSGLYQNILPCRKSKFEKFDQLFQPHDIQIDT